MEYQKLAIAVSNLLLKKKYKKKKIKKVYRQLQTIKIENMLEGKSQKQDMPYGYVKTIKPPS